MSEGSAPPRGASLAALLERHERLLPPSDGRADPQSSEPVAAWPRRAGQQHNAVPQRRHDDRAGAWRPQSDRRPRQPGPRSAAGPGLRCERHGVAHSPARRAEPSGRPRTRRVGGRDAHRRGGRRVLTWPSAEPLCVRLPLSEACPSRPAPAGRPQPSRYRVDRSTPGPDLRGHVRPRSRRGRAPDPHEVGSPWPAALGGFRPGRRELRSGALAGQFRRCRQRQSQPRVSTRWLHPLSGGTGIVSAGLRATVQSVRATQPVPDGPASAVRAERVGRIHVG